VAESEAQKKGAAPAPEYATHVVGKGAERVMVTAPISMTAKTKANFREVIEKALKASDVTFESLYPEFKKVNA
jgi:hypothetical protein